jgi:phosphopantothenoylcysteine decarboxylase / phosphopantothenate---cysteine ligase
MTIGFAAETHDLIANAKNKLTTKNLDMIIANHVGDECVGFNSDYNEVTVITPQKETHLAFASKITIAHQIINIIAENIKE